jgi:pimeloyl-ACP methyl ester carboxylesterase
VRQPEVAHLGRVLVAFVLLVLFVPLANAGRVMVLAGAFVAEFVGSPDSAPLSRLTEAPSRIAMPVPGAEVDRYVTGPPDGATPLVLVHGLTPDGKDDARLTEAAELFARLGFDVAVPTIPGLTRLRLRPDDVRPIVATLAARRGAAVVVGVSIGAGLAVLAAADETVRDRVSLVLSLGGYASAIELVRFYLDGEFSYGAARGRMAHDPAIVRAFVAANEDLLDPSTREALASMDPARVSRALDELSPDLRRLLDALSPERVVRRIRAPLILVHGRDDPVVPYSETLRLADARPRDTRVVLVGGLSHVEGRSLPVLRLREALALWSVMYRLASAS